MKTSLTVIALGLTLTLTARAQVPGIINYQGRIVDGGTNFNGTGQFKFALVNGSAGTTNYWSNNGTAVGQPAVAVSLTVTKGLYSVLLGDTTLANMTMVIAPAVFTNSDVRLRIWFNDGLAGFQQLSPDQRLGAIGYAMNAATVGTGAITSAQLASNLTINGSFSAKSISINGVPFLYGLGFYSSFVGGSGNFTMGGDEDTANGVTALANNTSGNYNTANGGQALYANTTGSENTANGFNALEFNSTAFDNTANGYEALGLTTTGGSNTANGAWAMFNNSTGGSNTANGAWAMFNNKTGAQNTANGASAMFNNKTGSENTADGVQALYSNTNGTFCTAIGYQALHNCNGFNNIGIGAQAGVLLTTGSDNIDIGSPGVAGDNNTIRIGTSLHFATYIQGITGVTLSPAGAAVFVNSFDQLGTVNSSRRVKQDIRDMGNQSDVLLSLRPVAFRYKHDLDPQGLPQFGLIAEEVEKVAPELVLRDAKGEVYTVRYEQINAMLLNEFQKEHRQIQTLADQKDAQIAELRQQNSVLEKRLGQMEKRLEQVSEQVEQSKAAPLQTSTARGNGGL